MIAVLVVSLLILAAAAVFLVHAVSQGDRAGPANTVSVKTSDGVPRTNGELAFVRASAAPANADGATATSDLYLVEADGSGERLLARGVDFESTPAWSPDGSLVAFVRGGDLVEVSVASGVGTTIARCRRPACEGYGSPAWSPDGTSIAVDASSSLSSSLWVMKSDGGDLRELVPGLSSGAPTWSPNGTVIAASGYLGSTSNRGIFLVDATTGAVERTITVAALEVESTVTWSPDGSWLAFDAVGSGGDLSGAGIYLIRPDGTDSKLLTSWSCPSNVCSALHPSWSPDGSLVAFTRSLPESGSDGFQGDIFVIDVATQRVHGVTKGPGLDCCPAWQR